MAFQNDPNFLFEQYKAFVKSSEALIERRQKLSTFHNAINTLLITIYSTFIALEVDNIYKLIAGTLFSFLGIVLSLVWYSLLTSYGDLNSSKFLIISAIEKQLPLSLYEIEWSALCDKLKRKKYVSFTDREKRVPILMGFLFLIIMIITLLTFRV